MQNPKQDFVLTNSLGFISWLENFHLSRIGITIHVVWYWIELHRIQKYPGKVTDITFSAFFPLLKTCLFIMSQTCLTLSCFYSFALGGQVLGDQGFPLCIFPYVHPYGWRSIYSPRLSKIPSCRISPILYLIVDSCFLTRLFLFYVYKR